jgi:hypothetical protein
MVFRRPVFVAPLASNEATAKFGLQSSEVWRLITRFNNCPELTSGGVLCGDMSVAR